MQHLELALRQLLVSRCVGVAIEPLGEQVGHRVAHVAAAAQHGADGGQDVVHIGVLADVAVGAGTQHVQRVLFFRVGADDEHRQVGTMAAQQTQCVHAVAVRHRNVEQQHVDLGLAQLGQRFGTGRGLGDHLQIGFGIDQLAQTVAHDLVVVGEQDAFLLHDVGAAKSESCAGLSTSALEQSQHEGGDRQHQEHEEQYLGDAGRACRQAAKTEQCGDQCNDEEYKGIVKHVGLLDEGLRRPGVPLPA